MNIYCAYADKNGTYGVGTIGPMRDIKPVGDCRKFETFDEADTVARDFAAGKYIWLRPAGKYVNMR